MCRRTLNILKLILHCFEQIVTDSMPSWIVISFKLIDSLLLVGIFVKMTLQSFPNRIKWNNKLPQRFAKNDLGLSITNSSSFVFHISCSSGRKRHILSTNFSVHNFTIKYRLDGSDNEIVSHLTHHCIFYINIVQLDTK